jgi:hypothetical protein
VAAREEAAAALDALWRKIDEEREAAEQQAAKRSAPATTARRSAAKSSAVKPEKEKRPPGAQQRPEERALEPGSLVLSPREVQALDRMLATHPELR